MTTPTNAKGAIRDAAQRLAKQRAEARALSIAIAREREQESEATSPAVPVAGGE